MTSHKCEVDSRIFKVDWVDFQHLAENFPQRYRYPVQGCIRYTMLYPPVITQQVAKRTLRGYDSHELPLALSSGFTQSGMSLEAAGMAQILKVLVTQKYGTILPSLHLQQLNPHIEEPSDQECVLFASEHLQLEGLSSYHGMTGQSLGGTMCHVITLGNVQV